MFGRDPLTPSPYLETERPSPEDFLASEDARITGASAFVINAAAEFGLPLTDTQIRKLADLFLPEAAAAVNVYLECLNKVLLRGASPDNQRNSIWDMYFALLSATNITADLAPVTLVTGDQGIIRACAAASTTSRVVPIDQYYSYLQSL